jgi:hypothetical protein
MLALYFFLISWAIVDTLLVAFPEPATTSQKYQFYLFKQIRSNQDITQILESSLQTLSRTYRSVPRKNGLINSR